LVRGSFKVYQLFVADYHRGLCDAACSPTDLSYYKEGLDARGDHQRSIQRPAYTGHEFQPDLLQQSDK